jgi:hypothetical protein
MSSHGKIRVMAVFHRAVLQPQPVLAWWID